MTADSTWDPYLSQPPGPRSSNKGPALLIAASVVVIGGAIAAAVIMGGDDSPPTPTAAPTEPAVEQPAELPSDLGLPNFELWTIDVDSEWRDSSVADFRELDADAASSFAGSWNVDGRVSAKTAAWATAHHYDMSGLPEQTLEEIVAEYGLLRPYWETAPIVSEEYFETDLGVAGWFSRGEGTCDQSQQCSYATYVFKDGVYELWVTAFDYDQDVGYLEQVTEVLQTARPTSPSAPSDS